MEQCERCGESHATTMMVRHLENLLQVPGDVFEQKLCADCRRVVRASRIGGETGRESSAVYRTGSLGRAG